MEKKKASYDEVDRKDFEALRKDLARFDAARDLLIKRSRDVIMLSKKVIGAVHRGETEHAKREATAMEKTLAELVLAARKDPALYFSGSIKAAEQEFVEAMAFLAVASGRSVPPSSSFDVTHENYLLGICDLCGELARRAINAAIKEDYATSLRMRDVITAIYAEMMEFDLRNSELRHKFDGIKYELKKMEDLVLELKLKEKI